MPRQLRFGKIFKDPDYGNDNILVNNRIFMVNDDGTLEFAESGNPGDFEESYSWMGFDDFNKRITEAYSNHKVSSVKKKMIKNAAASPTHWYRTFSVEKKTELCLRLKDNIERLVEAIITQSPNSKLNEYYRTLIARVQYSKLRLPELESKDIAMLPSYDESTDKLIGQPRSFMKLAAIVYPSHRRNTKYNISI